MYQFNARDDIALVNTPKQLVTQNAVNEHRDGPGQEEDQAAANGEVPEHLPLPRQADSQVDHRQPDAIQGMQDDGG
jgi:hypothetical protein